MLVSGFCFVFVVALLFLVALLLVALLVLLLCLFEELITFFITLLSLAFLTSFCSVFQSGVREPLELQVVRQFFPISNIVGSTNLAVEFADFRAEAKLDFAGFSVEF